MWEKFLFYRDVVISLISWILRRKSGSTYATYRITPHERFTLRRYSMDAAVAMETVIFAVYDRYIPPIQHNDWVIDVGAHIGTFSIHTAKRFPGARIVSLEPSPENFALLTQNIVLNNVESTVTALNVGIARQAGKSILHLDRTNTGGNSVLDGSRQGKGIVADFTTLFKLFKTYHTRCAFMKVDCEGAEYEIFLHCPESVLRKIHTVVIEYHGGGAISALVKRLRQSGFRVTLTTGLQNPILHAITNIPLCIATRQQDHQD